MTEEMKKTAAPGAHAAGRHSARHASTGTAPGAKPIAEASAKESAKPSVGAKSSAKSSTGAKSDAKSSVGAKSSAKKSAKSGAGTKSGTKRGAKSSAKKRGKKWERVLRSTFYRIYFAVVLLCVIGIAAGAIWLRGLLADYESAQPSHVAEAAARMFEDADYDAIYDYDTNAAQIDGDRQYYVDSMREIAQGKEIRWSETYSSNDDEKVYNVLLSGEKFAEMTLVPSGETTGHGFRLWKLGSVTTNVAMGEQEEVDLPPEEEIEAEPEQPVGIACHITVPSQFTVTVDGVTLDPADAQNAAIPAIAEGLLPEGVPNPTLTEYQVYSESGAPQISVTDAAGNPQQVNDNGDYSWSCALPEDAELRAQFEEPVIEMGKMIARCAAKTVKKDSVLRYCVKDSPARESINQFDDSTGANKKPESFENIQTSEYHRYSDNCFSCHVSFDYLSRFNSEVTKTYPTTLTLYFIYEGSAGKLYSFTLY